MKLSREGVCMIAVLVVCFWSQNLLYLYCTAKQEPGILVMQFIDAQLFLGDIYMYVRIHVIEKFPDKSWSGQIKGGAGTPAERQSNFLCKINI